ncbi:hypothetical protein BWQ96_03802 [Gracilariopsis chorda]|uniref:Uncharacterized protein n=1 Tax=Gracilariopsis chorda TaxID=448386 RepID=A0A2V3IW91_9FLOR|nr:hypothetical protein BWQ96_03802 [Gracilariopsis chorda]|eukprot:PXF46408.1 hypothetical protein BWQ96_03802 [Gracilariopsis chorda]
MAFVNVPLLPTTQRRAHSAVTCSATPPTPQQRVSRRDLLSGAAAVTAALLAAALPSPASANIGKGLERAFSKVLFPKVGFNAPDALKPSENIVDKSVIETKEGQAALKKLKEYDTKIAQLYLQFKENPQLDLTPSVRNLVSISELRNALNVVNEAIDEQSQTETDKIVRGIIQDISELEVAAVLKKGGQRTPKKIDRTADWFEKITGDFTRLLSFYS